MQVLNRKLLYQSSTGKKTNLSDLPNIFVQIKNLFLSLYTNVYSFFSTFLIHTLYAFLLFSTGVVFSRYLGVRAFGIYDYAEGVSEIFLALCLFGFDRQLISRVAYLQENKKWACLKGLILFSRRVTIIISLAAGSAIACFGAYGLSLFSIGDKDIQQYFKYTLYVTALIIPVRVYLRNDQAIMHGLQRVAKGHLPDFIVRPIILLCGALFIKNLMALDLTAPGVMLINLFAAVIGLFVSTIFIKRALPPEISDCAPCFIEKRSWIRSSIPLLLLTGATILSLRLGTILLGWIADFEQVAQYGIIMRVALVVNLIPLAINKVLAPKLSIAYTSHNKKKLNQLILASIVVCLVSSLFIGGGVILIEKKLLHLFGDSYTGNNMIIALRFFIISNIFLSPFAILAWLLMMTNHNWQASLSFIIPVFISPLLFILLVPVFHILGAVLAYIITSIIRLFLTAFFVKKLHLLKHIP